MLSQTDILEDINDPGIKNMHTHILPQISSLVSYVLGLESRVSHLVSRISNPESQSFLPKKCTDHEKLKTQTIQGFS